MKQKIENVKRQFWDILLSSVVGCVSYFILVYFADELLIKNTDKLLTCNAFITVVIAFVCLGFIIRYVNIRMINYYYYHIHNSQILLRGLMVSSFILAVTNYLLLVATKFMAGVPNPFILHGRGCLVIFIIWLIELLIVRQVMLNHFYRDLIRLYKQSKDYEEKTAKANYTALQNQLNPHFLFNSLNTLISEIEYNPEVAISFTRNLADVYRYILYCQNKNTVSLNEELDFVDKYIMLHKVRLGNCISLDNQIDASYLDVLIPPLTLQLLIENVIKHNTISNSKPMIIRLYNETINQQPWLCIKNNRRIKMGVLSSGKGLSNLDQRFRLLYNIPIQIESNESEFTVKVPLVYE